jgi:hypothetical protein
MNRLVAASGWEAATAVGTIAAAVVATAGLILTVVSYRRSMTTAAAELTEARSTEHRLFHRQLLYECLDAYAAHLTYKDVPAGQGARNRLVARPAALPHDVATVMRHEVAPQLQSQDGGSIAAQLVQRKLGHGIKPGDSFPEVARDEAAKNLDFRSGEWDRRASPPLNPFGFARSPLIYGWFEEHGTASRGARSSGRPQ